MPLTTLAAGEATIEADTVTGERLRYALQWRDAATVRVSFPDGEAQAEILVVKGRTYLITPNGTRVIKPPVSDSLQPQIGGSRARRISFSGPSGTETVAGIEGRVYRGHWRRPPHGAHRNGEMVFSDDPLVREMTDAWLTFALALSGAPQRDSMMDALLREHGMLRVGESIEVLSVSGEAPSAGRFAVPEGDPPAPR